MEDGVAAAVVESVTGGVDVMTEVLGVITGVAIGILGVTTVRVDCTS